ncbi:hypothetical protein GCM10018980_70260 [Streptomyces capoamus]|uniref:Uncharacterized protein n=1 Tax=Streptomyces capoamus TaxID=68183 RepID=A0A919F3M3_9ACTN|nr:hypothetical protein [Streptomyces capoamus]GGW18196.1 hypothetical protein GCM10010501_43520 [Streptomyces libani subsp. rufus]GHG73717.1 hypothetical protein GCM10018980_70260 [Streptomyces capoamus]
MSLSDATLTAAGKIVKQAQGLKMVSDSVCRIETVDGGKPNRETVCESAKELDRDGGLKARTEAEATADAAPLASPDDIEAFKDKLAAVADPSSAGTVTLRAQYCDDLPSVDETPGPERGPGQQGRDSRFTRRLLSA